MSKNTITISVVPDESFDEYLAKAKQLNNLLQQAKEIVEDIESHDFEIHIKRDL